ncbi:MAG: pseudaminic acid cytidylyltransferase [Cyclobacteriaceae bacterium]|nr:pseudaminic acid cytidylyltransferase [Cyclobacteriaceae bacterium]
MKSNLAIIPARGRSKRIPGKNIKPFLGKPIIAYSIENALQSGLFEEIMVSTDDEGIADLARKFGANVPFLRSEKTSDDHAILNDVLREVVAGYRKMGRRFDAICMLLSTAPLIRQSVLLGAHELLIKEHFDSVRPVVKYPYPIQRSLRMNNNRVEMFFPENYSTRSQDLEPAYHDAGQFYWINKDKGLTDPNKGGILIPEMEAHDIDSPEDWEMAELKYKLLHKIR